MESDYGIERELSDLQNLRATYLPPLPPCLEEGTSVRVEFGDATTAAEPSEAEAISELFPNTYGQPLVQFIVSDDNNGEVSSSSSSSSAPMRVGVVFCGRQSPGGNNVVWGIYNALKTHNPNSVLLGFLGGSEGLYAQKTLEITDDILTTYKNQGGYDLLGRTKDQIRTIEQVNAAMVACTSLKLDGLVIIGGVTSNTDAAHLAETFAEAKCPTKVVGVPVTLNGDLKNQFVETNVGFDTVCKVNSQLISNVCSDALSAEKYYYFIRLMGRKASHVALECTLQSHPNMVIISEEVSASNLTLFDLTKQICDAVQARAEQDKYHGVILLPEGLIESIPEVYALLQEIHGLLEQGVSVDNISSQLSPSASALFECLPPFLRKQLLLHPESDDSAQLSQIETEKLFAHLVEIEMNKRLEEGTYKGKKFNAICHFFGYQARGSLPSKFDCDYAFVLGHVSYHILAAGLTGYLATVTNLKGPVNKWHCGAAPITAMMTVKPFRHIPGDSSPRKPALHPATVDLNGKAYGLLRQNAMKFLIDDVYRNLGPIQFDGPASDSKPATLCIEDQDFMDHIKDEEIEVDHVKSEASPPLDLDVNNQETTAAPPAESGDVPESHDKKEVINSELITNLETRENENVSEAAEYIQEEEEVEAAESVDIPESHNEEEAINSELVTNLESRKYDNVPEAIEAVENVQEDGQESFPASNPEEKEKEASITKNPCDSKIEDPAVQKNSSENDNNLDSPGDFTKPETEGVDILCSVNNPAEAEVEVEAPVTTYPCDCRIEDALVPNGSPENDILDSVNNPVDAEEEDEASVTIYPCDCRIEYADVNNDSSKNDNILHLSGDLTKPKTEGGDLLDSVNNPVEAEEEKEEEALETKYPCDCRIEDEAVQNESSENDNNLHLSGDVTKPETEGDDLLGSVNNVVVDGEEELLIKNPSACDIQDADIKKDPSDNNNNNLHLPEIEGGELLCPDNNAAAEEEEALLIKDPSACDIQDADVPKNPSDNINNNNLHSLESEGDELLCPVNNTVGAEEEEEASETKDLMIPLKDSSENENNLHSPDDSMKPETEEGDLLCPVNAAEVKIQFTRVSDKVEEILKATEISDSSCHANGGPVHDVTSSAVAITNGGNLFSNNAAVLSQPPVQFGSFVPTVYQVNGGSGDNSIKKIISPDVKGLEHVRKSDVPKPSPSLEIEEALAVEVESVKRPFNYLIKMPKFYDDELNDQIRKGEVQVSEKTQKRDDIKYKMQTIRENMHHARNNLTDRVSEERAARRLIKLKRQEIDAVQSIINRVKNAISVDDIDARIKHMEHMMQHETLALKEEKQFIREIKQMKLCREQLSSNIGSQDEVEQRDQIEDKLKILKKDLERLKSTVSAAEATVIEADKKFKDEKKKLQEVYAQHGAAQDDRQEAYMKLQNLRKQYYDKNACWRRYKDDSAVASDYSLSGDKGALHRLCLNQVEKMMELWNNDDEFRKEYIRCNTRSTLWRLKTLDGRALGPDEEPPVFSNFIGEKTKSYNYKVAQASPSELTIVSAVPDKKEKPIPTKEAAVTKELKSEEKVAEKAKKADKDKKLVVSTMKNNSSIIKSLVGNVEKSEEVIIISKHDDDDDDNNNNKQKREEEEAARKEEQRRKAEEEAKLKELKRLEEIAKAKEALERKRKIAEKAQIRAEARAQKEAELKDKEKEKRAKKKERKKTGGGADSEGGEREKSEPVSGLTVETTLMESETNKEIHPLSATEAATASKKQQKAFKKHQTKLKSISAMPEPLRNKNKKRMQQWIWIIVTVGVVAAVVLLGNLGFYPNNLGGRGNNNRHPGF